MKRKHMLVWLLLTTLTSRWLGAQDKLIAEGDSWRIFKGTEDPPPQWNTLTFADGAWLEGATPIGYGPDLSFETQLTDMQAVPPDQAGYFTFYARRKFTLSDAGAVRSLSFSVKYDDGYIAYVNGREVLRKSMPAGEVTRETPGLDHETNVAFELNFLNCDVASALQAGENVLAVEVHNATLTSSDCAFSAELAVTASSCPTNLTCQLRPTGQILVRWAKPVGILYDDLKLFRNNVLLDPGPVKTATSHTDRTPLVGVNAYKLVATLCGVECPEALVCEVTIGGGEPRFRRGDLDENGSLGINDAVVVLNSLFRDGGPFKCPDAADADDNGSAQLTDAVFILRFLFQGGETLPPPLAECGTDPTPDDLVACAQAGC